jgi:hypothetical protein
MPYNEEDVMVDIFKEWAVTVHRCQPNVQARKTKDWGESFWLLGKRTLKACGTTRMLGSITWKLF